MTNFPQLLHSRKHQISEILQLKKKQFSRFDNSENNIEIQ